MAQWFAQIRSLNLPLNGDLLRTKALKFATDLGVVNFEASNGWIDKFKKR